MGKTNLDVRPAMQAGKYYPAEPDFLARVVDGFLAGAGEDGEPGESKAPKAIIAPHGGYIYSGAVAGRAFRPWKGLDTEIARVVIMGPSHTYDFPGLALPDAKVFATPLGEVALDAEAVEMLLVEKIVRVFEAAHLPEHSIEVQLPFIQRLFGKAQIIPLIVGRADAVQVASIVNRLWGGEETVFVLSSDLSLYHDYGTAKKMDLQTARLIENFDHLKLTADQACGFRALRGFLRAALKREMRCRLADLRNSGDTAGETGDIVGYGAFHFHEL